MRLISLPSPLVDQLLNDQQKNPKNQSSNNISNTLSNHSTSTETQVTSRAGEIPVSSFNPNGDFLDQLDLIKAEGVLEETLACFQMLTKSMKLPFRRDSIEKILRDLTRRGQSISIQVCGKLAAGLGLHVTAAKVPAIMGTRLQIPTLIPWGESFALVARSNQTGLTLVSPKEGIIDIKPEPVSYTHLTLPTKA